MPHSEITAALMRRLRAVPLGDTLAYALLDAEAGADVRRLHSGHLSSALRILARDEGVVFETIRGLGLRRRPPDEAPDIGRSARQAIRRRTTTASDTMRTLAATSNGLAPDAARRLTSETAMLGLIHALAEDRHQAAVAPRDGSAGVASHAELAKRLAASFDGTS